MFLRRSQLLEHNGSTFGNGLFGAPKGDTGEPGFSVEECILRVIINAVPPNEIQATIEAELDNLPAFSQWALLGPLDREAVLGSSEEQSCCFYLCGLEDAWLPFFVLDAEGTEPIEAADVDASWAAVCVFPMGWRSACGIVQHLSMQLVRQARQRVPVADRPATLGRITGLPASAAGRLLRFLQVCPDVNEQGRVVVRPTESQGLPSEMQQALRDVCAEWGVARSEKKASFDVLKGLTLCVEILAQHGRARPASLSICKFWSLLWHAMGFGAWRPSHLSNMGAVLRYFKQFRACACNMLAMCFCGRRGSCRWTSFPTCAPWGRSSRTTCPSAPARRLPAQRSSGAVGRVHLSQASAEAEDGPQCLGCRRLARPP